jgi:hypothetical protein
VSLVVYDRDPDARYVFGRDPVTPLADTFASDLFDLECFAGISGV